MIGIVVVSHSKKLAEGVLELVEQMTKGVVPVETAGGIDDPDNPIGTDPMQVMACIESVAATAEDGVLVIMDLGSALMSAETALEFLPDEVREKVLLCSAPIVEGALTAAVQASVGASLQQAAAEANGALQVKIQQLAPVTGEHIEMTASKERLSGDDEANAEVLSFEWIIENRLGLHARPAAALVTTAGKFESRVLLRKVGKTASAKRMTQVALLGVKQGERLIVEISGPDADAAAAALNALHKDCFGEREEEGVAVEVPVPSVVTAKDGCLSGLPGADGYAQAPAYVHQAVLPEVIRDQVADTDAEVTRFQQAVDRAVAETEKLQLDVQRVSGRENAAIFQAQALLLKDDDILEQTAELIKREKVNAEYAWQDVMARMADEYRKLDNAYMQARAADVQDCALRVMRLLSGEAAVGICLQKHSIIVAHELTPSDVAGMDSKLVGGIVTEVGGLTSHAAILARSLGFPAVIGVGPVMHRISSFDMLAVDGFAGQVWIDPEPAVQRKIEEQRAHWLKEQEAARAVSAGPALTQDGHTISVCANIGSPAEAFRALALGAEGVGLFRTEFLFLGRDEAPTEEEQYEAYVAAAQTMQGRPVIIRTLDIGGDKSVSYLDMPTEANPFLGERGVRFCMARSALFRTQLRALLHAASQENIRIMYPMISDVREFLDVLTFQNEVQAALKEEGIQFDEPVKTGIMIEVPAAVAMVDKLAACCDYFSIGTNDLTQYVMAADRGNSAVSGLCDSLNPAVLRMIKTTCDAATKAGIGVGMCGELAGNAKAVPLLIGLGLNDLSMNAMAVPAVKQAVRSMNRAACQRLVEKALNAVSGEEVRQLLDG